MNIRISIAETHGIARCGESITFSCPFPAGSVLAESQVILVGDNGTQLPLQTRILGQWPDGTIKWLQLVSRIDCRANETIVVFVTTGQREILPDGLRVEDVGESILVHTGQVSISLPKAPQEFRPFAEVRAASSDILTSGSYLKLTDAEGHTQQFIVNSYSIAEKGPLKARVRFRGRSEQCADLRFESVLTFYHNSAAIDVDFTIHNCRSAVHKNGLWDLGDPNSYYFKALIFDCEAFAADLTQLKCYSGSEVDSFATQGKPLAILQDASGGENWQSPVHRNRHGNVTLQHNGYRVSSGQEIIGKGLRTVPILTACGGERSLAMTMPLFWQEYPNSLSYSDHVLSVGLFPESFSDIYELQGGEKKTKSFFVDFAGNADSLAARLDPLLISVDPSWLKSTQVIKDLPEEHDLVDSFCQSKDFLEKREHVDEYGWRHFGEVYADHEAVGNEQKDIFVSHYNNQYDLLAGFYRKYLVTGDSNWKTLAQDLARHVVDIDIYHTDQDREEYNHGLFWHTDHYVPAGLGTHRSYSREQKADYALSAGGGGPGSEHCYTTGLKLHYYLTGDDRFKEAVIDLARWEQIALTGPRTVLAALKRGVDLLKKYRSMTDRNFLLPRFPLTRGSGNAITACLDAFELSNDRDWLSQAAGIITSSIHPDDDISARQLNNIEIAWSYTVFLVAVGKFIDTKILLKEFDSDFEQARKALLAYAMWMTEYEYPYLNKPERLEYPNETWAAQELRKAVVFYDSARFCRNIEQQTVFFDKSQAFFEEARKELMLHPTSSKTRPVALMLQNGWVGLSADAAESFATVESKDIAIENKPTPHMSVRSIIGHVVGDIFLSAKHSSLKKEIAWLSSRV